MRLRRTEQHTFRHDHRRAPADLEQSQEQGEKQQFRLLGLHDLLQVLRGRLVVERAGKGRIGEDKAVAFLLAGDDPRRANPDASIIGFSMPCRIMFIEPMRSIVGSKSKPWNAELWKCVRSFGSRRISGCFSRKILACRDEEAAGAARGIADRCRPASAL